MDALVPAFVAALLAEIGDKTQWLALALALHFRRPAPVLAGIACAAFANAALAALAGALLAPRLTHEAATLLVALALLLAGAAAWIRQTPPDPPRHRASGALLTSLFAFLLLELGDKTQFLTFALALRSGSFWLTAAGAAAGVVLASAAAVLAAPALQRLPLVAIRRGVGALFLLTGLWAALSALRLI